MAVAAATSTSWFHASAGPWSPHGSPFCERPSFDWERRSKPVPGPCNPLEAICHNSFEWRAQPSSRLLSLPLEVRMHIYEYVHLMSPAPCMKTTSSPYPMPTPRRCFLKPVQDAEDDASTTKPTRVSELMYPDRPTGGLPTALLLTSKQVYDEARLVPMRNNEFAFVNWFSSGLWSAHFFLQSLKSWQWVAIRHIRLEMLAAELGALGDNGESLRRWSGLCEKLAYGLRGLRLRIIGSRGLGIMPVRPIIPNINNRRDGDQASKEDRQIRGLFSEEIERCTWVTQGLAKLWALERLELDMVLPRWTAKEKLAWCKSLEDVLRRGGMRTTVVCVERVSEGEWEAAMQADAPQAEE